MTEHTPGRLLWDQGDIGAETPHPYCDIYTDDETIIAQVNDCIGKALGAANARRLCAAWNACKDIPTEVLEGVNLEVVARVRP